MTVKYRTLRKRASNRPIPPAALRIIQELECLEFGYALGGDMRTERTDFGRT